MIEVWGRRNSSNVIAVMWAIGELGLDYKRHNVGGTFGALDSPEYLAINPNHFVPTIQDGELVMWESNAIVRYLSAQYGQGALWPQDPAARARSDQWMEWTKATLYGKFMPIFFGMIRTPAQNRDQSKIDAGIAATNQAMAILEQQLGANRYVGGETLTMGDIPLGTVLYRYFNLDIERPSLPNIEAWYLRLCQRPAYQHHVMVPFGGNLREWLELEKTGADIQ